ncbi:MAG TPA: hypothetical protein VFM09_11105 [Marmoricola sp.]|nr:hypothetical protein [Marmoricola sp.]
MTSTPAGTSGQASGDPDAAAGGSARLPVRRRVPVALPVLLGVTVLGTVLWHSVWPGLLPLVRRDADAFVGGQVWRAVTPLLVQPGPLVGVVLALVLVALVGWPAERWFGSARMAVLYLGGAVAAHVVGQWWGPHGAGVWVAGLGVLGGFAVWWLRMRRSGPVSAGAWTLVIGVFLVLSHDLAGVALLAGAVLGIVVLRDVPAVYRGRVAGSRPPSSGTRAG